MIAALPPTRLIDQQGRYRADENGVIVPARASRWLNWLGGLFGFLCFMPYLAINAGNNTAIQAGNLLTLLMCLPLPFIAWRRRSLWIVPALMAPRFLSTLALGLNGGDIDLATKNVITIGLSLLAMMATQIFAPAAILAILSGVAVAALVHVLVGCWQIVAFQAGYLPLEWFYTNQSFLSVQENADIIVRYIQRPFGLFPEPSALGASLAPFVLLWFAMAAGLLRLRQAPSRRQTILFSIAALGSLAIMIASRSGHAAITLAGLLVLAVIWFKRSRATPGHVSAIFMVLAVALPLLIYFAVNSLQDRLGGSEMGNSSWAERSSSLLIGLKLLAHGNFSTIFFGLGTGMTSPLMQQHYGMEAIWSISLTYIYETGIVGLLVCVLLVGDTLKVWRKSRFDPVFMVVLLVWLVGVTITTSYTQLLPLWVALAMLTNWMDIFQPHCPYNALQIRQQRLSQGSENMNERLTNRNTARSASQSQNASAIPPVSNAPTMSGWRNRSVIDAPDNAGSPKRRWSNLK